MSELTSRKASGHWFSVGLGGELTEGQTLSCCHCQRTWILQKGSGRMRGYCPRCDRYHCGNPECFECVPVERRLENAEAGRNELTPAPAMIVVPGGIDLIR